MGKITESRLEAARALQAAVGPSLSPQGRKSIQKAKNILAE